MNQMKVKNLKKEKKMYAVYQVMRMKSLIVDLMKKKRKKRKVVINLNKKRKKILKKIKLFKIKEIIQ